MAEAAPNQTRRALPGQTPGIATSIHSSLREYQLFSIWLTSLEHVKDCLRQLVCDDVVSHKLARAASVASKVVLVTVAYLRVITYCCYGRLVEGTLQVVITLLAGTPSTSD